jgi:hypothetical protein
MIKVYDYIAWKKMVVLEKEKNIILKKKVTQVYYQMKHNVYQSLPNAWNDKQKMRNQVACTGSQGFV